MSNVFVDRSGHVFGNWTIQRYSHSTQIGRVWLCRCECGTERPVLWASLHSGTSKSCGGPTCSNKVFVRTHGQSKTKPYRVWKSMVERCESPTSKSYANYGGRGITVSPEWRDSFEAFLRDMGYKPGKEYSLERIDNNLGYWPGNVIWGNQEQQSRNKRTTHILTFNGITKSMKEWSESTGIGYSALRNRINVYKMSIEDALTRPIGEVQLKPGSASKQVFIDHVGEKHGEWEVLKYARFTLNNGRAWECQCSCGKIKEVYYSQLKSGKSKACRSCAARMRCAHA